MTRNIAAAKTRVNTAAQTQDASRTALIAMSAVGSVVGVWVAACFVGALVSAGGPLSLIKGFFTAVVGL